MDEDKPGKSHLSLESISFLQESIDGLQRFLAIFFAFDRLDSAARFGRQRQLEFGVLTEAARVAKERILFVVVDGSTLVALIDILSTIGADARVSGDGGRATRTLEHLRRSVQVFVKGGKFNFQITASDG